jgi:hypothetical protein
VGDPFVFAGYAHTAVALGGYATLLLLRARRAARRARALAGRRGVDRR